MNTQNAEINLLSDDELNAVTGGMMNNGQGTIYQVPRPRGKSDDDAWLALGLATIGMIVAVGVA